jgi:selT/selW/selH-like putative selenoprotein
VKAELIEGSGGAFDVEVDGKVIFAKAEAGRFPEADEIIATISD